MIATNGAFFVFVWYNLFMKENKLLTISQEFAVDIIKISQELKRKKSMF